MIIIETFERGSSPGTRPINVIRLGTVHNFTLSGALPASGAAVRRTAGGGAPSSRSQDNCRAAQAEALTT
jgi:hypothetical protein